MALVGLYTIVKYLGEGWINWLLGWYFSLTGVGSVWNVSFTAPSCIRASWPVSINVCAFQSSVSLTRYLVGEAQWKSFDKVKLTVKKGTHGEWYDGLVACHSVACLKVDLDGGFKEN